MFDLFFIKNMLIFYLSREKNNGKIRHLQRW